MKKVGNEGVITVEEAKSLETELEVVEGMLCITPKRWGNRPAQLVDS
jgi:hypothetical protein